MNVVDIMTSNPRSIRPNAPLRKALKLMHQHHFMHLPVLNWEKHLIGIVSDRDCRQALNSPHILRERWQDESLLDTLDVRTVMTPAPIVIESDAPVVEAARLMLTHNIGCLPVMKDETLVGIITRSDILSAFMILSTKMQSLSVQSEISINDT